MYELARVAVVGAGRMGRGIALSCAIAGIESVLVDLKSRPADDFARLDAEIAADLERELRFLVGVGLLPATSLPTLVATVRVLPAVRAANALSSCDLIFEGVPETSAAKRAALGWIGETAGAGVIVASTTSTMGVNEVAAMIRKPERFLNAHWLNPAHLMPLVEISVGGRTDPDVTQRLQAALTSLGKVPVVCSASPGYIVPRIQALAMNEAARLVEEGVASAADVDTAVRVGFGLRFAVLGLLEFIDWGGNDILYYASGHLARTIDAARYRAPAIIENNMRASRNGVRDGAGFYDYRGVDVDSYRRQRLAQFVRLLQHLDLLPRGLAEGARHPRTGGNDGGLT
jgi:3-hydroxybutyryl-CoA dehydrogenase